MIEKEEVTLQKLGVDESLIALKDCKRVVELRYKTILVEQTNLNQMNESLLQQNLLLETQNTNRNTACPKQISISSPLAHRLFSGA